MKKISDFSSENAQGLEVKFSIHLNRRVFVMYNSETIRSNCFIVKLPLGYI